jgi:poly(hydroxyalkanoate) granule-associated protein
MATRKPPASSKTPNPATGLVQESAQQIWLAGLGAFAKAQEEGSKVFQGLVKEGLDLQRQTKAAAEEKLAEASAKLRSMAEASNLSVSSLSAKAAQPWDKLETIFEERVAKALTHLGTPSLEEVTALKTELAALKKKVAALEAGAKMAKPVKAVKPKVVQKTTRA